jgi:hypothetical protein
MEWRAAQFQRIQRRISQRKCAASIANPARKHHRSVQIRPRERAT